MTELIPYAWEKGRSRYVIFALAITVLVGTLIGAAHLVAIHLFSVRFTELLELHSFLQMYGFILPLCMAISFRLLLPARLNPARWEGVLYWLIVAMTLFGSLARLDLNFSNLNGLAAILMVAVALVYSIVFLDRLRRTKIHFSPALILIYLVPVFLIAAVGSEVYEALGYTLTIENPDLILEGLAPVVITGFSLWLLQRHNKPFGGKVLGIHWLTLLMPIGAFVEMWQLSVGGMLWLVGMSAFVYSLTLVKIPSLGVSTSRRLMCVLIWLLLDFQMRSGILIFEMKGIPITQIFLDVHRHSFAVGVVMQSLFIILCRFKSEFGLVTAPESWFEKYGFYLLNIGVVLRALEGFAAYNERVWMFTSSLSGPVMGIAVALLVLGVARPSYVGLHDVMESEKK